MNYTTFENLTVGQAQRIIEISKTDDDDKDVQYVSLLTGMTREEVLDLTIPEFNKICREAAQVFSHEVTGTPERSVRIKGKKYGITYDPRKLSGGQFISIQHWNKSVLENMHLIFATLLHPVSFWGKSGKLPVEEHEILSFHVQDLKFTTVISTCVFFSLLWDNSLKGLVGYLESNLEEVTGEQKKQMKILLQAVLDGSTMRNL